MLRDADPKQFNAIYLVCGRTDMRLGIDSLAAIIETQYHLPVFVPNTLFLFCGRRASKKRDLSGKEMVFCFLQNVWKIVTLPGHVLPLKQDV